MIARAALARSRAPILPETRRKSIPAARRRTSLCGDGLGKNVRAVRGRRTTAIRFVGVAGATISFSVAAGPSVPGLEVSGLSTMIMSLALVIGFIFAAAFVAKRMPFGLGARGNSGALKVLAALPLGPKERLLLVQAKGEELLIAVSPAGVFNVGAQAAAGTPASVLRAPEPAPTFVMRDEP
jgi:flagellar protein FliO/FliZ